MRWINVYGLVMIAVILVPNIVFAIKCRDGFDNMWHSRFVSAAEQIGRFSCFALMVFNIPGMYGGFASENALHIYLVTDGVLILAYCLIWIICFKNSSMFRAAALSVLPAAVFLFSGIMSRYILLIIAGLIFAPAHILLSCKNAALSQKQNLHYQPPDKG